MPTLIRGDRLSPEARAEAHQTVQPWMFGEGETKAVCLWLRGLPRLVPTNPVPGRHARVHRMAPGPERQKERSRFFSGIARAMAEQWGGDSLPLLEKPALPLLLPLECDDAA